MSSQSEVKTFLGIPQKTRDGMPWTDEDISKLWELARRGMTSPKMQFYLLRTPAAIRSKLHRLRRLDTIWQFEEQKSDKSE